MLKNRAILLVILVSLTTTAVAQSSGYMGKKVIFKTDMTVTGLGQGIHVEQESALLRRASVYTSYSNYTRNYSQKGYFNETGQKATYEAQEFHLGLKLYLENAFTAPKGRYFFMDYMWGRTDVIGKYRDNIAGKNVTLDFQLENIPTSMVTFGSGTQNILFDRLTLDAGMGFTYYTMNTGDYSNVMESMNGKGGYNIFRVGGSNFDTGSSDNNIHYNYGFLMYLKIGILAF